MRFQHFAGRVGVSSLLALGLAGCASQEMVHFGGTLNPTQVPVSTVDCSEAEERFTVTHEVRPNFPNRVLGVMVANQSMFGPTIWIRFDIDEDGNTRNIRYARDMADLERGIMRAAVRPAARAVSQWEFQWSDAPGPRYATDCETGFTLRRSW